MEELAAVKQAVPDTPVLANTGVKHETVAQTFEIADGCIVGSSLKYDGDTWNAVDPERALLIARGFRVGIMGLCAVTFGLGWLYEIGWLVVVSLITRPPSGHVLGKFFPAEGRTR